MKDHDSCPRDDGPGAGGTSGPGHTGKRRLMDALAHRIRENEAAGPAAVRRRRAAAQPDGHAAPGPAPRPQGAPEAEGEAAPAAQTRPAPRAPADRPPSSAAHAASGAPGNPAQPNDPPASEGARAEAADRPAARIDRQGQDETQDRGKAPAAHVSDGADTPAPGAAGSAASPRAGDAPASGGPAETSRDGDAAGTPPRGDATPGDAARGDPTARDRRREGPGADQARFAEAATRSLTHERRAPRRAAGGGTPPRGGGRGDGGGGGGGGGGARFHRRMAPGSFEKSLREGKAAVRGNMVHVMLMTFAVNVLLLSIPIYLFQISDRVLTSRSVDTLIMLTAVIAGAVILQAVFDAMRRFMLMRTAVEVAARLGGPVLSAAAHASLHSSGREYQTLGDLQQVRSFLTSGTLLSFLDVPFAPLFMLAIFLVHPDLGFIVVTTAVALFVIAVINQRFTARPFAEANQAQSRANLHLDSMMRNSQIINALAMIPEAVTIWGRDTAASLTAQVRGQDRNVISAMVSRGIRLLTQVAMLGWGAYLAILGEITGGMVIAASIIAGRALAPVEGAIEGWNAFLLSRAAYGRIADLLTRSGLQVERLRLPEPRGQLDVERLLYVPQGTKRVVLNALTFRLPAGETLAVIGNSGAGKTTLGKMLVGSLLPTSGAVRLDLMDLRNWDPRQLGENIGYLPQDVQLFPGTIKANIARMRDDARDEDIHRAAVLADVHDMIASLPHGYETVVAADGSPLSGGQKQRIALARAFFGDPRLLVLDEPNSNLDVAGDKALAQAIAHAKENGITVVVITQKPALLSVVDKIMMLADGNIALSGSRDEVLRQLAQHRDGGGGSGGGGSQSPAPRQGDQR